MMELLSSFTWEELSPVWVSIELSVLTTAALLMAGTPIAWWLARKHGPVKSIIGAVITLPLVLPPSVLGFYLLIFMGPEGPLGRLTESLGLGLLTFTFPGLLIGSVIYSLPFMIQPIQTAFESLGNRPAEVAATLGVRPLITFFKVVLPLCRPGFFTGIVLTFAHTIGEFGVVLMIGGNMPGKTQVMSTEIYSLVEAMEYGKARVLAGGMLVFSFLVLLALAQINRNGGRDAG